MLSLNRAALAEMSIPIGTGWLLGACMEARGRPSSKAWNRPTASGRHHSAGPSTSRGPGERYSPRSPGRGDRGLPSHGFQVARYVSLERIVEQSKDQYYRALAECSDDWHEGRNAIVPWWNYFLDLLRRACGELELQMGSAAARPAKSDLVRQAVLAQVEQFTLGDLAAQVPVAGPQLIKKVLAEMKQQGTVRLVGRGRGARREVVQ